MVRNYQTLWTRILIWWHGMWRKPPILPHIQAVKGQPGMFYIPAIGKTIRLVDKSNLDREVR